MNNRSLKYTEALVTLYHLISLADGKISDREERFCELMKKTENITEAEYEGITSSLSSLSQEEIYNISVKGLKSCSHEEQIKCMAWMRLIANSDGYMAREEWALIFRIYKKELQLSLKEIIECELPQQLGFAH